MAASMSKEEYLKRYLGDHSSKKKPKKTKKEVKLKALPKSKIVDDDIDIKAVAAASNDVESLYEYGEDAPQVAGIVDERPEDIQKMEEFSQKQKWKALGASSDEDNVDDDCENGHDSTEQIGRWNSKVLAKDKSVERTLRHDSADESDKSPPRRSRHDSGSNDGSPPRRLAAQDQSPPRKMARVKTENRDSESDQSPIRRSRRRSTTSSDQSPIRRSRRRSTTSSDQSPPRKSNEIKKTIKVEPADSESDQSPPRRSTEPKLLRKTLDGKRAGLQDAATLRRENDAAGERERRLFDRAGDEVLGRHAQTIVRDRASGKRRDFKAEEQKKLEAAAVKEAREAKYKQWNKGLKQVDMQSERLMSDLHEISKPLARYEDDEDLDKVLRDQERDGDPMLAFIKKKKKAVGVDPGKEVPKYNGPAPPPNRYGINPGYRWDGVDRSNGFEKSRITRYNDRKANLEQAYKWSVEDM